MIKLRHVQSAVILLLLCIINWGGNAGVASAETTTPSTPTATTIVVNDSGDYSGSPHLKTCTFTGSGGVGPSGTGGCTLRRAMIEAAARPNSDRPIAITFNIPTTDPGYNATLQTWNIQFTQGVIETSPGQSAWSRIGVSSLEKTGNITIDGSTQPGGRLDGPPIIIDTRKPSGANYSVYINMTSVTIRHLAWKGGGLVTAAQPNATFEHNWMGYTDDGTGLEISDSGDKHKLARGGFNILSNADNSVVQNNYIIGSFGRAINLESDNSTVTNNTIGTDTNGNVPLPAGRSGINCPKGPGFSLIFDPAAWYGGWGMQISGNNNTITDNRLAGLHSVVTENETTTMSFEIFGNGHTITGNTLGRDADGDDVGNCGIAFLLDGRDHLVTDNLIVHSRDSFSNVESTFFTQDMSIAGGGLPFIQVYNNIITDSNEESHSDKAYRFGSSIASVLRKHVPAKVTSIVGTTISGTNGDPVLLGPATNCGNCTVYLYLDDADNNIEALEFMGTGTFNVAGTSWTGTLNRALVGSEQLRTQNMTNAAGVIANFGAKTTTRFSDDLYSGSGTPLAVAISNQQSAVNSQQIVVVLVSLLLIGSFIVIQPKKAQL